jgi:hypothetical protein
LAHGVAAAQSTAWGMVPNTIAGDGAEVVCVSDRGSGKPATRLYNAALRRRRATARPLSGRAAMVCRFPIGTDPGFDRAG